MNQLKKIKPVSVVGLDMGSYSVKCVELVLSGEAIELRRASILPVKDPESLKTVLKLIFDPSHTQPGRVRISVSGPSLLVRRITLPLMTPVELRSAIRFEAESHLPFPVDDCVLDFQILGQGQDKKAMNVMLVAVKRDFVKARLELLSALNIFPEVVDADIFCLLNAFEMLGDSGSDRAYGLLNIGHAMSSFAIIHDKVPFFVREIPFGGVQITKALSELRHLPEADADGLKLDRSPEILDDLRAATRKGLEPLADEITHSIDYYENEAGEDLKHVWMSGGAALSYAAPETLSAELGKEVTIWDNIKKIKIFERVDQKFLAEHSAELNVAFGMILRGTGT
ncbi:MAG: type IV pilus assembly protein PilM [Candidatus Omnitrophica bacterium]|nr:type IV pilus assembly protein PilM [Candidatus Omnitrophota bacterium]